MTGPTQKRQTLEEKQREKTRLLSKFKAHRREEWDSLTAKEPRLLQYRKSLRGKTSGQIIYQLCKSPLRFAATDIRYAALRIIDRKANTIARQQGRQVLDDPMPPERNLYIAAREILNVR